MKPTLLKLCAAALAAASFAGSAFAHRAWILPSSFTLSGEGQWVEVDRERLSRTLEQFKAIVDSSSIDQ